MVLDTTEKTYMPSVSHQNHPRPCSVRYLHEARIDLWRSQEMLGLARPGRPLNKSRTEIFESVSAGTGSQARASLDLNTDDDGARRMLSAVSGEDGGM